MKLLYTDPTGERAAVRLKNLGDGDWEVQRVDTLPDFRGEGLQRAIWEEVCRDADAEGASLLLTVGGGKLSGLSSLQLYEWYTRLGFHGLAGGGVDGSYARSRMERPPHPAIAVG